MTELAASEPQGKALYQKIGLLLGPLLFGLILLLPVPEGLSPEAWKTVAVALFLATWWATEAIPVPATSLLPLVLLPLLGITDSKGASLPYSSPVIYLLLGGFIAAMAMQKWNLHRRIALNILARVGDHPYALIGGFMAACALLSMWISNTATTLMIIPIAITVASTILGEQAKGHRFTIALLIGCAWSASIGGLGTYIGTPPNLFVTGFIEESTGREILFYEWMMIGVPIVMVMVPLAWLVLTRICFPFEARLAKGGSSVIQEELAKLGTLTTPEKRVAIAMTTLALAWSFRQVYTEWDWLTDLLPFVAKIKDMHIAVAAGLAMFIIPADSDNTKGNLLDWESAVTLPWGVILLFGGGLSIAAAIKTTGLALWLGEAMSGLATAHLFLIILAIVALITFLTELTSNTATTAALVPVLGALATTANIDPIMLAAPAAMAASCAFMLPVATGPNAVIFSTGEVKVPQMIRAGLWLNVLGTFAVSSICYFLLPLIF
ncbi:DASS family sodium-coupled anion symporter [Kordiimonas sp. SCSIO 12603]|uniref:SLC13 family permease n=1 Tax=Kordiimonas sp. SCSIO 12603 TaxID=2829596 RepID=UPI002106FD20|nr:DASS family sodium-coupled anion symporter [Kordiimonas sp. SCSIO 12603]UTW59594.1 DASS family sodium-coupled anion symporter [Kordiimonas sp. SCSIO 12603]